ncbi:hypothetical protein F4860DRAFT_445791 [Xylaria cubensis]|nr:hypothetical protein F4860DRAFT_445791 [Xylaria cubensis]
MTRRKQTRYFREKEWKPPRDLVIPSQYSAQYTLPPPGYNPMPSYYCAPSYHAYDYQYTQGYRPAWSYQPAQRQYYNWAPNYQSFLSYQPIAAPSNSTPMLPAPSTIVPYTPTVPCSPYQICNYGPSTFAPTPALFQTTFPPPHY